MGCQRPRICGTTQESHFPHLPPCISQPKDTSGPHVLDMLGQPEGYGYTGVNPPNGAEDRRTFHPTRAQLTP